MSLLTGRLKNQLSSMPKCLLFSCSCSDGGGGGGYFVCNFVIVGAGGGNN